MATATSRAGLDTARLLALYRQMQTIRRCEEHLARAHQRGLVHGACHTYVGEEAIAVGVCAHLRSDDVVFSTHRGHGHALAKGVEPRALAAELFGRATGCSHGRGGSMHLFAPKVGLMGTSGIVGPCILQAAGAGYSFKLLESDLVAVAFFGDGAVNNGAFHEGLNMASIWKLPVLFVCENNGYAVTLSQARSTAGPLVERAAAYGMAAEGVDGMDVEAVLDAARRAVARGRAGDGPTFLECRTYRYFGHHTAERTMKLGYRSEDEIAQWRERDPLLLTGGKLEDARRLRIDDEVEALLDDALEFARQSARPDPSEALDLVYASGLRPREGAVL